MRDAGLKEGLDQRSEHEVLADPRERSTDLPDFVVVDVDVETACSRVSSICQVGIVGFRDGREIFAYETLVDPCDEFHTFNTRIHGIAPHHVVGHPNFGDVHAAIAGHLSSRITVAHSYFDKGALAAACHVHGRPTIETLWLDSVRVARRAWPDLSSHRLNILSRHLGIAHKHHDALSDARAAGMVVVKAIDHTGIDLAGWMTPAPRRKPPPAPPAAESGPLKGERVAILGEARDGPVAQRIAAAGGRVVSVLGTTTTLIVIAGHDAARRDAQRSSPYYRAKAMQDGGHPVRIVEAEHALDLTRV